LDTAKITFDNDMIVILPYQIKPVILINVTNQIHIKYNKFNLESLTTETLYAV